MLVLMMILEPMLRCAHSPDWPTDALMPTGVGLEEILRNPFFSDRSLKSWHIDLNILEVLQLFVLLGFVGMFCAVMIHWFDGFFLNHHQ